MKYQIWSLEKDVKIIIWLFIFLKVNISVQENKGGILIISIYYILQVFDRQVDKTATELQINLCYKR